MEITIADLTQVLLLPEWAALRRIDLAPPIEAFVQVAMLLFVVATSATAMLLVVSSCVGVLGGIACLYTGLTRTED
ncbi:MAG: hypothetical protein HY690_12975 [Chloroflexi bacterium]|nr:hypothetical protein [Chloroflexota bacterium]